MNSMDLYHVFYHAALHESFTRASEVLFVTQSSVSQSIRQLETALGMPLFYRKGRTVSLTAAGATLFDFVSQAIKSIEKGEKELMRLQGLDRGHLQIGASDTLSRYILMSPLQDFHRKYPNIRLSIQNRPSPVSKTRVREGALDLALVNHTGSLEDKDLVYLRLTSEENVWITSETYAHAHGLLDHLLSLSVLASHPLITLEKNSTTRRLLDDFLARHQIHMEPEFEFGSVDLIVDMIASGVGIGFVPKMAMQNAPRHLVILETKEPVPSTDLCLIHSRHLPLTRAAEAFLEVMQGAFLR
jgi:DNA-binding transcriptional LysR family regulator